MNTIRILSSMFASCASIVFALASVGCGAGPELPPHAEALVEPDAKVDAVANSELAASTGRVGVHGMVLFGHDKMYLSHIPMFTRPHDLQLVVEASLASPSPRLPTRFDDGLFTFQPRAFSLDALRDGALTRISGTVFRGNFEDGGRPIANNVEISVARVVFAKELGAQLAGPSVGLTAPADARYLALGSKEHAFVLHLIARSPSFDQIAYSSLDGPSLDAVDLAKGVFLRTAAPTSDLASLLEAQAVAFVDAAKGTNISARPVRTLACLDGPDFASPCQ